MYQRTEIEFDPASSVYAGQADCAGHTLDKHTTVLCRIMFADNDLDYDSPATKNHHLRVWVVSPRMVLF